MDVAEADGEDLMQLTGLDKLKISEMMNEAGVLLKKELAEKDEPSLDQEPEADQTIPDDETS